MPYKQTTPYETEIIRAKVEEFLPAMVHFTAPALHRYEISSQPDGTALVHNMTNDNDDDGVPDGRWDSWTIDYPSVSKALKDCGKCRVGISGVIVTVTLDGKEVR